MYTQEKIMDMCRYVKKCIDKSPRLWQLQPAIFFKSLFVNCSFISKSMATSSVTCTVHVDLKIFKHLTKLNHYFIKRNKHVEISNDLDKLSILLQNIRCRLLINEVKLEEKIWKVSSPSRPH